MPLKSQQDTLPIKSCDIVNAVNIEGIFGSLKNKGRIAFFCHVLFHQDLLKTL